VMNAGIYDGKVLPGDLRRFADRAAADLGLRKPHNSHAIVRRSMEEEEQHIRMSNKKRDDEEHQHTALPVDSPPEYSD